MSSKIILTLFSFLLGYVSSATTYDQRQTGELNVQVDFKDLRILAMTKGKKEEYVDYDYAYDYSEMTIKPQNGTTPKPLNGTSTISDIKDNTTSTTTTASSEQITLAIKNNSTSSETVEVTLSLINDSSTTIKSYEVVTTVPTESSEVWISTNVNSATSTIRPTSQNITNCKKGLVMNQKGDCELKLQGAGNALLKLVKLSQKLKLRRENRRNQDNSE